MAGSDAIMGDPGTGFILMDVEFYLCNQVLVLF